MTLHHPLQWRPLQNPFPLEGEGWDGGGVPPLRHSRAPFFVIPGRREPTARTRGQVTHPQPDQHPRHSRAPFFVIPAKAGTHGPDQGASPPSRHSRRREPTARTRGQVTHPQRTTTPVIPRSLLRHSREGGNPRPGPGGKSPTLSRTNTPVIPAPPSSSFPRRREPTARTRGQVTHPQPDQHPRHSRAPFFVIPAKAGTHGPDQGASPPTTLPPSADQHPVIPASPSVVPAKAGTTAPTPSQVATT